VAYKKDITKGIQRNSKVYIVISSWYDIAIEAAINLIIASAPLLQNITRWNVIFDKLTHRWNTVISRIIYTLMAVGICLGRV